MQSGRDRTDDEVLRRAKLLRVLRRLLSEADAVRPLRSAWVLRRLLSKVDAVDQATLLLRPERLLPQAVDLRAAVLAGMVQLRCR